MSDPSSHAARGLAEPSRDAAPVMPAQGVGWHDAIRIELALAHLQFPFR